MRRLTPALAPACAPPARSAGQGVRVTAGASVAGHVLVGPRPGDPWKDLAIAVLLRAVRDSLTDPEAVAWLRGPGDDLVHALGWPAGVLQDYDPARVNWREVSLWSYGWRHRRRTARQP
jgi:hypothetical protein